MEDLIFDFTTNEIIHKVIKFQYILRKYPQIKNHCDEK